MRDSYDLILVDTPALLAVTDPSVVALRVDGVLLNVRVTSNDRPLTERARDVLRDLQVPVLGVVVNGMNPSRRGYEHFGGAYAPKYSQTTPMSEPEA
ncbi:MAG TPA: hypothetical protein VEL76_25700 [Gemmataceae bacterium]|nr:hypothetical protein [Gemmataceae bacterium]